MRLAALTKNTVVLFETLKAIQSSEISLQINDELRDVSPASEQSRFVVCESPTLPRP